MARPRLIVGSKHESKPSRRPAVRRAVRPLGILSCFLAIVSGSSVFSQQNDSQNDSSPSAEPVLVWRFEGADPGSWTKAGTSQPAGPRPPQFPGFSAENHAGYFGGDGTSIVCRQSEGGTRSRFSNGDAITLESWVRVASLKDGQYAYLIGKGRTRKAAWADLNHNYALRLQGVAGRAAISFLFASAAADQQPAEWHRWTSSAAFTPGDTWHHVAVSYLFGQPESLRGFIDGRRVTGEWDMGGATTRAPVQDEDDVVVGTGNGGGAGNSLHGWLDEVAVYRAALPDELLLSRYQRIQAARRERRPPPSGQVLVELCENGLPTKSIWPDEPPEVTESWLENTFGFFEVPYKYVDSGVRGDRPIPYLLRASATITIPPGRHRLLLRGRGASQLLIDGHVVLSTPFPPASSDGHHPISRDYLDLGSDFRFAPPGNRESWAWFESDGKGQLVELETIVGSFTGNKPRRPELGETVVAIALDRSDNWQLLSPAGKCIPYTDAGWRSYEDERRQWLTDVNAQRRAAKRAEHQAYWDGRRALAQQWLSETKEVVVPELVAGYPAHNEIDRFLAMKLQAAAAERSHRTIPAPTGATVDFFAEVQPILQARCLTCHRGAQAKGGLRLDRESAARLGGDSGAPAIVAGNPRESELLARVRADGDERMPPDGDPLSAEQVGVLERWIATGAVWPSHRIESLALTPLTTDLDFLRRVTLDTVGVVPTPAEIDQFLADPASDRRARAIDRLLQDPRWADHWMGYWQDVLAENPNILNPTLNNTGPFRWWIHESLLDDKPMDLFVTELIRMKGSERLGGPVGFGVASQNDVPMAAKGTIVSTAFLGIELKCARCHDSPYHESRQEDLFQLSAMLSAGPLAVPKTSSVPLDKLHQGGRQPLIEVTLQPGTQVAPHWPFPQLVDPAHGTAFAEDPSDPRDCLAALITAPHNRRFAQVMANRVWQRFMGRGIVEPVDDWEQAEATHPELLEWLGRELVRSGYSVKQLSRLILNSHAYQRATDRSLREPHPLFAAPSSRRLTAEQLVDSLFSAVEMPFGTEEVNLDVDGQRDMGNSISLGRPSRAWMFASTSNERDRPSLSLPRVQAVVDLLTAFGWRAARQDPTTRRDNAANILQPAVIANGTVSVWLTRLTDDHAVTRLALQRDVTAPDFLDKLYLRLLTRLPTAQERESLLAHLTPGFDSRIAPSADADDPARSRERQPPRYVSWSNHLSEEANEIKLELEAAARSGYPPSDRLNPEWRARAEDVVWAVLNAPEWIYMP